MGFMNTGFLSMTHRRRFCEIWNRFPCKSPKFISAIFLLTSSEDIWLRSKDCITANGKLDISRFSIRGISTTSYTLYMAARDLYFETDMVSIFALTDKSAVPEAVIDLIHTAIMIRRNCLKTVRKLI